MKKYLSNSIIWGPVVSFVLYTTSVAVLSGVIEPQTYAFLALSTGLAFLFAIPNIPTGKDLDFIASTNATLFEYLLSLFRRNIWFHLFCLAVSLLLIGPKVSSDFINRTFILMLLMVASSAIVVGMRIQRYEIMVAFVIALLIGMVFPYPSYLILSALILIVCAYELYTKTLLERDLV